MVWHAALIVVVVIFWLARLMWALTSPDKLLRDDIDTPSSLLTNRRCGLAWVDVHVEIEDAFGHVQLRVVGDGRAVESEHHEPVEAAYGRQVAHMWKLDRLGRSVQNLVDLMSLLQSRGVGFRSLTENMDTTTPGGVLIFNVFAAMAQFERDLIRERTNAGLQAARARGHMGGRPSKLNDGERARIRELYQGGTLTVREIAKQYGVARNTIYNSIK